MNQYVLWTLLLTSVVATRLMVRAVSEEDFVPPETSAAIDEVCSLPPETGKCRAYNPMYYYDAEFGECLTFIYGGCGGNDNKFKTEEKCKETCQP